MSPRRFLTDSDRYPWRSLKIIGIALAVLLTAVCGGGGGMPPRIPRTPPPPPPDLSFPVPASPFILSPDGAKVAAFRTYSSILIYDWQARSHPLMMEDPSCFPGTNVLRFSPDGNLLAHICMNGKIVVWETNTGRQVFTSACGFGNGSAIAWSHDGQRLAAACKSRILIWDVRTGKKVSDFQAMEINGRITGLALTRSGEIYSSDSTGWVRLWSENGEARRAVGFNADAWGMLLSPDEKQLAIIQNNLDGPGYNKEVVLWDSATGTQRRLKGVNADLPELVTWSPDSKLLVLRIWNSRVAIFSTVSNRYVFTIGGSDRVRDAVFRPDGTIVAIVGSQIRTWRCCEK